MRGRFLLIVQSNQTSGAETKARILEVAAELFHDQGFEATGVATILRHAGAHSGSLYHFFPSKEALLVGVMERHLRALRPMLLDPAERASDDPIQRVFALLDLYRRDLRVTGCKGGCPVGNLALEVGDRKPEVRVLVEEYFSLWVRRVRGWLEQAGARLPTGLDRGALSRLVLSVMEGGVMQARAAGELGPFDAAVAQLRAHLDLLIERADHERRGTRARALDVKVPAAQEAQTREASPSQARPTAVSATEARPVTSSDEDDPDLDRTAWRNW
jgi:AcrR family transcriptional regulator